ncbi:probable pectinesterase/pectinesterase inhibitor 46 [Mercurialis annua]|uniref:probable pectinesterase/pectinesterase inhibitor 46 n=1 Tax=Mercurialis annua TaxID=3986 RepID=UPI00215EE3D0|nr:probable pectinesterase/pectinesterase inhibitor 46 [Mercurialis annua]
MSSFKGKAYGKVDENEHSRLEARRRTRKRISIIILSSILLAAIVVAAVVGSHVSGGRDSKKGGDQNAKISASVKAVCDVTLYKDSCYSSLAPMAKPGDVQFDELFKLSIEVAMNEISKASHYFSENGELFNDNNMTIAALKDCRDLLDLGSDRLNSSLFTAMHVSLGDAADDLRSWLSAAGSYQETCIDGLKEANLKSTAQDYYLKNATELTSNSLAILTWISKVASSANMRGLLSYEWVDRKLLQSSSDLKKKANVVVAKDGSGKYKTIRDALKAVPDKSKKRFIIYVKRGIYKENVRVEKTKWNVMIIGDGMNATIVSASLNVVDGTPTFSSATFAVFGKGFIARDMGFRNTAGPAKHQAVALMSAADMSVFHRCSMDAFQDTLYAHSHRQFYRECDIHGTVDFIFGNSAVVLQNCNILPRKPMLGQQNTITAQGRFDPNQNTGISIQNCTIRPYENLTSVQTFLGRPWKNHSTTVYMQSMMDSFINPTGWLPWVGDSAPPTIFYAEYQNFGPGSSTKDRVKWKGLKNITHKQASKFTANAFLQGDKWIQQSGVTYKSAL